MKKIILLAGLISLLISCSKEKRECPGSTQKTYDLTGFTKVKIGDANNVTIRKGTGFSIVAKGCATDLADLDLTILPGQILEAKFKNSRNDRYRVDFTITLPTLVAIHLSGAAKGEVSGFQDQNTVIRTQLSGASECKLDGTGINLQFDLSGASTLTASGNTLNLYGSVSGASTLSAYGVEADEVDIIVSGASKAWVAPVNSFFVEASGASRVYYKGDPVTKHFETSGNAQVIKE
jgi:hypothetical protein